MNFITQIIGLVGVLIGATVSGLINYFADRRIQKQNFKMMLFEKRLPVYQKAHFYLRRVFQTYGKTEIKNEWMIKLELWLDRNYLFLDPKSRKLFHIAVIRGTSFNPQTAYEGERKEVFDSILKAHIALFEGLVKGDILNKKELQEEISNWHIKDKN